ncbi:hypothetical protein [Leifsonia sp. NPDC058248]|uniref:hypothetical protein n=1 Tax=Leifsonia sp. NPDC058248 TaxID=3346402 RepID=UPI0036DE5CC6
MSIEIISDPRQEYIDGLRKLADLLESNPDLPTPYISSTTAIWSDWNDAAGVAKLASLIPGAMRKNDPNDGAYNAEYYELTSDMKCGPFQLQVRSYRATVCAKVQTGTKTVMVAAVKAAPARIEEVPVYEFVCSPLLAKAAAS